MIFGKTPKSQTPPRKPVQDSRFSLKLSPEWNDRTLYFIEGPEEDGIRHHITVKIENNIDAPDITAFAAQKIKELANSLEAYQEMKQGPVRLNAALPAYDVLYQWTPDGKRPIYQRMMFALAKRTAFTLTATFSEKTSKRIGPEVERIFRSFGTT